jgi:hypothetical protein
MIPCEKFTREIVKKRNPNHYGDCHGVRQVRNPGPSREDGIQEDLGSLCCVFPMAHGTRESCSFSEEDQGGLEQLVRHDATKTCYPNQVTRAKHNDYICDCKISKSYTGKLEFG